jgi:hypothetical protein
MLIAGISQLAFLLNEFMQRAVGVQHKKENHLILVYNFYLFKFGGYSTKYKGRTLLHESEIRFLSMYFKAVHKFYYTRNS